MFTPHISILQRYAMVLVNFAIGSGNGIKPGEVVRITASESAKPLYREVRNQVIRSGGHVISNYMPDDISREIYELASDNQLEFFPEKYMKGLVEQIDHTISIFSDTNLRELEGLDPEKIMKKSRTIRPFRKWLEDKENNGKYTWTLALYGTEAMAKEANLSIEEYWDQIIKACFLDQADPISAWKSVTNMNNQLRSKLDNLKISKLNIQGEGIDLEVKIGKDRKWLGGSGRNIPSFEVFISPDWRGTEGKVEFDQPLYRYGTLIEGIKLKFKEGRVVEFDARTNKDTLASMIANENADKIGEFSLTDKRMSKIDKFMAETLYDENISGANGNMHIALGNAYKESYTGDIEDMTEEKWRNLGFNESVVHTDVVSTIRRTVTAHLEDGSQLIIYKDGEFTI